MARSRSLPAGHPPRCPRNPPRSRLRPHADGRSRRGYWRRNNGVQHPEHPVLPPAPLSGPRAVGHHGRGLYQGPAGRPDGARALPRLPRMAEAGPVLLAHRRLQSPAVHPSLGQRTRAHPRRTRRGRLFQAPRRPAHARPRFCARRLRPRRPGGLPSERRILAPRSQQPAGHRRSRSAPERTPCDSHRRHAWRSSRHPHRGRTQSLEPAHPRARRTHLRPRHALHPRETQARRHTRQCPRRDDRRRQTPRRAAPRPGPRPRGTCRRIPGHTRLGRLRPRGESPHHNRRLPAPHLLRQRLLPPARPRRRALQGSRPAECPRSRTLPAGAAIPLRKPRLRSGRWPCGRRSGLLHHVLVHGQDWTAPRLRRHRQIRH